MKNPLNKRKIKKRKIILMLSATFPLTLLLGACSKGIPVFGITENGKTFESKVDPEQYAIQIENVLNSLDSTTAQLLDKKSSDQTSHWQLSTIVAGLGFVGEVGIGVLNVSVEPRIRFVLSNKDKFTIP